MVLGVWYNLLYMTEIYIYADDSGVFDIKDSQYFIYAGYIFVGQDQVRKYRTRYKNMVDRVRTELGWSHDIELKAAYLKAKHKKALGSAMTGAQSFSLAVDMSRVYSNILESKMNKQRYKDYVLKRAIKSKLVKILSERGISKDEPIRLIIKIDEQPVSSSGVKELEGSITKEFRYGRLDGNGRPEDPILNKGSEITLDYMDSKEDYLVQASDILANKIWTGKNYNPKLLNQVKMSSHLHIDFP